MKIEISTLVNKFCEAKDCDRPAVAIVATSQFSKPTAYCKDHEDIFLESSNAEFEVGCPNCGCCTLVN